MSYGVVILKMNQSNFVKVNTFLEILKLFERTNFCESGFHGRFLSIKLRKLGLQL